MKKIVLFLLLVSLQQALFAQGVKIGGGGVPNAHAILELDGGNNKGLLLPRLTNDQMTAMNAPDGMVIYNNTNGSIYLRKNSTWQMIAENNNNGGFGLPLTASHQADDGYVLNLTNTSYNGVNGGIRGASSTSGYGVHGHSFTGIGGYFTSQIGPSLVTGTGPVGIGTPSPAAKLHAVTNTQDVMQLENTGALASGTNTRMLFKTGGYFTGGVGTSGVALLASRLSFYSSVAIAPVSLIERMSILHNGNVGINKTSPLAKLDVAGKIKATAQGDDDAALELTGAIKMGGTDRAAFVLTADVNNRSADGHTVTIDHPHANNNPNAIIFVTARNNQDFSLKYNSNTGRWYLYTFHYESSGWINLQYKDCNNNCQTYNMQMTPEPSFFSNGNKFNILIIKG